MTVQDGKPKLQVDTRAKRLQACGGVRKKRLAPLQSGVKGVGYHANKDMWSARLQKRDFRAHRYFCTSTFKTEANTWEEARAAALQAAV
eukprot:1066909-Amphidinium_carterae.1